MWRLAVYISGDKKKSGLIYHKAGFKALGLFLWDGTNWLKRFYSCVPVASLGINGVLIFFYVLQVETGTNDAFIEITKSMMLVFVFLFGMVKTLIFHVYREELKSLIEFLEAQPLEGKHTKVNWEKLPLAYVGLLVTTGTGWAINGQLVEGILYKFPFKEEGILRFAMLLVKLQADFYVVISHAVVDTLMPMFVSMVIHQGLRFKSSMSKLGEDKTNDRAIIKKSIILHANILKAITMIRNTFSLLFICQVSYTVIHGCSIIFAALKVDKIGFIVSSLLPLLCSAYTQLFLYCYSGQRITTLMDDLFRWSYNNKWYRCRLNVKKKLVVMQTVGKIPVAMHSFGVTTASLATYLHSCQESFSYFLALKTITSK